MSTRRNIDTTVEGNLYNSYRRKEGGPNIFAKVPLFMACLGLWREQHLDLCVRIVLYTPITPDYCAVVHISVAWESLKCIVFLERLKDF